MLSQFPEPDSNIISEFEKIFVPQKTPSNIVKQYGPPYYIKIDVEQYDNSVLKELFSNSIFPPFISSEYHSVDVFATLVSMGGYACFKLLDSHSVSRKYCDLRIQDQNGVWKTHSFPFHSAGPFGEDIEGDWLSTNDFLKLLAFEGTGWKDIHATNLSSSKLHPLRYRELLQRQVIDAVWYKFAGIFNSLKWRSKPAAP